MDRETLAGIGKGIETMAAYTGAERNGYSDFYLSDEVLEQVKAANELSSEEKIALYDGKAAELRVMAADIRDVAKESDSGDIVEVPGNGTFRFEFHGRRDMGKDGKDEEVSLSMSLAVPRGAGSYATFLELKRLARGDLRLIKNNARMLDLTKRKIAPQNMQFVALFDALETVEAMHKALGLDEAAKQRDKSKS